ncbi:MAG: DUF177 domain-containing protein [Magnetococcales bacterium]|nr:DUF177 domain-containing protein [Magnetococcales bacterium]
MRDLSHTVIDADLLDGVSKEISGCLAAASFAEALDDSGAELLEDVWVDLTASRSASSRQFTLRGTIRTTVQLECALCLEPFQRQVALDLNRCFVIGADPANQSSEVQMTLDVVFVANGRLALLPVIEEELILDLPMVPYCRTECAGLCPGCGSNLNVESCSC